MQLQGPLLRAGLLRYRELLQPEMGDWALGAWCLRYFTLVRRPW